MVTKHEDYNRCGADVRITFGDEIEDAAAPPHGPEQ